MINGIGPTGSGRADTTRSDPVQRGAAPAEVVAVNNNSVEGTTLNPAAELAASGPPIDAEKVAAIRAAIAEGRYPIDPQAIAEKMIELDLPAKPKS